MNQESIYKSIENKDWESITNFMYSKRNSLKEDPMIGYSIKIFYDVFLQEVEKSPLDNLDAKSILDTLYLLHMGKFFTANDKHFEKIISEIIKREINEDRKYEYATTHISYKVCYDYVEQYKLTHSSKIQHSQEASATISANPKTDEYDYRISLLKSKQECDFFEALRDVFPTFQIYPNVATSCLLNWSLLQEYLNTDEKEYFFKSIVDFVVFDQINGYLPKYFFELDSIYHDSDKQKRKDKLKDSIFQKAGVQIYRIRKQKSDIDWKMCIRDIIKSIP